MSEINRSVLVIDDDEDILVFLSDLLESGGFEPLTSLSGEAGLRLAAEKHPDLILLDIMMPEMDGHETCRALKANTAIADIPVVVITARNDIRDIGMSLHEGAEGFVSKPFDTENLLKHIEAKLSGKSTAFYAHHERVEIPSDRRSEPREGDRIAFLDVLEPQSEVSAVIDASDEPGVNLMSIFQLPREANTVETTALLACESADNFGTVINRLVAVEGTEVLGCRVYDDVSHIPVDIMDVE